jgi:flagellar motor switch protein FliM
VRPEPFFKAERAIAQHSVQLGRRAPEPDQLAALLAVAAPRLEQAVAAQVAALIGGDLPVVACSKVERCNAQRLHKMIDPVAVNWLFDHPVGGQVLVSLGIGSALALTDMVFGGPGVPPAILPDRLPKSADIALVRAAEGIGAALGHALERDDPFTVAMRSDVLGKLVRARDDEGFLALRCCITQGNAASLDLTVAMRLSHAPMLLAEGFAAAPPASVPLADASLRLPFADLPMQVVAVLADLKLPVARIAALKPGDMIALSIPHEVPLRLQGKDIARGQAGTAEGMLALRITKTGWASPASPITDRNLTNG